MMMLPLLIPVGVVSVIGVVIYLSHQAQKKRTSDIHLKAEELGLSYYEDGASRLAHTVDGFHLMSRGRAKKYRNVITAETPDVSITIFDYQFTTGSGKSTKTHHQTVTAIESLNLQLPTFRARPENMLDGVGNVFGLQDIDFDDHPGFSNAFVLKSDSEEATRKFFDFTVLEYFADKAKLSFEGTRNVFLFYEPRHRVQPENLKFLLEEGYRTYGVLRDRANRS